jgi:hypothetical protein
LAGKTIMPSIEQQLREEAARSLKKKQERLRR